MGIICDIAADRLTAPAGTCRPIWGTPVDSGAMGAPDIRKLLETAERSLRSGYLRRAEETYERAVRQEPSNGTAWLGWADVARRSGRADEADRRVQQGLKASPNDPHLLLAAARTFISSKRIPDAVELLRRASTSDPSHAEVWHALGQCLMMLGQLDGAIEAFTRAVALHPESVASRKLLAVALGRRGRVGESAEEFARCLAIDPADARCHVGRATALLLDGRLLEGFAEYEWRRRLLEFPTLARTVTKGLEWDGSNPAGKTLLLYSEQGLGDVVQFIRYAPLLADRGATVLVEVQAPLAALVRSVRGVSRVIIRGDPLPAFDAHASLMSLPHRFGTTLADVPSNVPYIAPDDAALRRWSELLPTGAFRAGITWAGNPDNVEGLNRSLTLEGVTPLLAVPGVTWVALQKGANEPALSRLGAPSLGPQLNDFTDTAAVVSQLDLVVSVDTAVAHVAGALAKPTWVLLPSEPDFRWLLKRDDSPWYPTMRLFRQEGNDWNGVVRRVADALRERVSPS